MTDGSCQEVKETEKEIRRRAPIHVPAAVFISSPEMGINKNLGYRSYARNRGRFQARWCTPPGLCAPGTP